MSGDEQRSSDDERLAVNLRMLREGKPMSQADLARQMTALGHPWHQSTVYRVETGKQVVSYGEAGDLARIFGVQRERFAAGTAESDALEKTISAAADLGAGAKYVARFVHGLLTARANAEKVLAETDGATWPRVRTMRDLIAEDLDKHTLDAAIAEGARRHKENDDPEAGS
jgi:transcriptional regulator with XRE-family HTH domain